MAARSYRCTTTACVGSVHGPTGIERLPPARRGRGVMRRAAAATMVAVAIASAHAQGDNELRVHAAGSLRAALTEVAQAFERSDPAVRIRFTFGASGLLKDRIAAGEPTDLFASANMEHPQALVSAGLAGAVQRFARNAMCALVAP